MTYTKATIDLVGKASELIQCKTSNGADGGIPEFSLDCVGVGLETGD